MKFMVANELGGAFVFSATLRTEMAGPNEFLETVLCPWFLSYIHTQPLGKEGGSTKQHPHHSSRCCPALANCLVPKMEDNTGRSADVILAKFGRGCKYSHSP